MLNVKFKNSKELIKVLGTIENILRKNKEENQLRYVKLDNINNKLCISARNTNMRLKYIIEDTINIEGTSILYEFKTLFSLLNVLDGEISIIENTISNDKCEYIIPNIIPTSYPEDIIPNITNKKELIFEDFKQAIINVLPAISPFFDVLSGVYIDKDKLVTCDQNRLFVNKLNVEQELDEIILPKELVNEILKLPFEEKIYISTFGQNIIIEDEFLFISSNMINKKYPNYKMMLPKQEKNKIMFNKKDLEKAINLMLPIIDNSTMRIDLNIYNSYIAISCRNGNKRGDTEIDIESNITEELKVKFNAQYLIDMLKTHKDEIEITTYSDNVGFNFKSENSTQFIMPLI